MTEYQLTKNQISDMLYKATQLAATSEWGKLIYCVNDIQLLIAHLKLLKSRNSPGSEND